MNTVRKSVRKKERNIVKISKRKRKKYMNTWRMKEREKKYIQKFREREKEKERNM